MTLVCPAWRPPCRGRCRSGGGTAWRHLAPPGAWRWSMHAGPAGARPVSLPVLTNQPPAGLTACPGTRPTARAQGGADLAQGAGAAGRAGRTPSPGRPAVQGGTARAFEYQAAPAEAGREFAKTLRKQPKSRRYTLLCQSCESCDCVRKLNSAPRPPLATRSSVERKRRVEPQRSEAIRSGACGAVQVAN